MDNLVCNRCYKECTWQSELETSGGRLQSNNNKINSNNNNNDNNDNNSNKNNNNNSNYY